MAGRQGHRPSSGSPTAAGPSSSFYCGARVEYYSKSYDEWIPAVVDAVKPDGQMRLLHDDGAVLKEQADPSLCRIRSGGEQRKPSPEFPRAVGPTASTASSGPGKAAKKVAPAVPKRTGSTPSQQLQAQGERRAPVGPPPRPLGQQAKGGRPPMTGAVKSGPPARLSVGAASPASAAAGREASELESTINARRFYVGDRIRIKESGREGEVMYIGTPAFASKEIVGMRLDEKRSKSECDGKAPNNERLFRCQAGYGIFLPSEDVEALPREDKESFPSVPAPEAQLDVATALSELIGLAVVKQQLSKIGQVVEVQKKREGLGVHGGKPLHFGFRGGHGTGMSTVARLLAHLLRDLEVVTQGQLLEVNRKELFSGCTSCGDIEKQMTKLWRAASGGALLVNDVHAFQDRERSRDEQGAEATEWLAKQLDAMQRRCAGEAAQPCWPQPVVVILASPADAPMPEPLQRLGLHTLDFPDYSHEELSEILVRLVARRKFSLTQGLDATRLQAQVRDAATRAEATGEKNLVLLQRLLDDAIARQTERVWTTDTVSLQGLTTLIEDDFVDSMSPSREKNVKLALAKLDGVVGLKGVKNFINSLYAQLKTDLERREAGIHGAGGCGTLHMIFTGNPGTGKTTVARIVAELLQAMGLLRKGHIVEADRATLVAGYSGQTALKTKQVVDQAMGGVLFVDEAYALVADDGKDAFGHEALDTLIKMIEDRRQDLVVILAGYPEEMTRLIASNPGVRSRFPVQVSFEDYSEEELMQIGEKMLLDDCLVLSHGATQALSVLLKNCTKRCSKGNARENGNGRAVRNMIEQAKRRMAVRLQSEASGAGKKRTAAELCTLEASDFAGG